MLTFKVLKDDLGKVYVNIYDENALVIHQPFNPDTGKDFADETEAKKWAEEFIQMVESKQPEQSVDEIVPTLEVQYQDESGEIVKIIQPGVPVYVSVELYTFDANGNKQYVPVTGKYIVPYYKDEIMVGTAIITIENGKGKGKIILNEPGIYTIKPDRVLNAETLQQPSPLPKFKDDAKLIVADDITVHTTDSNTEKTQ